MSSSIANAYLACKMHEQGHKLDADCVHAQRPNSGEQNCASCGIDSMITFTISQVT